MNVKIEAIIKKINIAKTHKIGLITSLLMAFFGTLYGYFNRSALAYGAVYSFRALGLYILFYCLKCCSEGAENLVMSALSQGGARLEKDGIIAFQRDVKRQITTGRESSNSTVKWKWVS